MLNDTTVVAPPFNGAFPSDVVHAPAACSPTNHVNDHLKQTSYPALTESTPASTGNDSLEDKSRLLAEEDKRRRNTAASARFRVKKKQREQALERTVKEQTDKMAQMETIINQLRMENKWLRNLVTDKHDNKDDIAELWRKFRQAGSVASSTAERKDGVGTAKPDVKSPPE
jgi:hypothetical protein